MKKKLLITFMVLAAIVAGSISAYAAAPDAPDPSNPIRNCMYLGKAAFRRGYSVIMDVLKDKFAVTDEEINSALESGKTLYDLAKEKGIEDSQLKDAVIEERTKAIDEAVSDGIISEEQADFMKDRMEKNQLNRAPGQCGPAMRGGFGRRGMQYRAR